LRAGGRVAGIAHDVNTKVRPDIAGVDVTVGIPTRNRSALLGKAIRSVLGQTYPHFALVVSDNASEDDTASVVASFRDPRLVYRPVEHTISRPANFNRLIEFADTEFVVILGDDDELHPDHLSLTVETLKRWPNVGVAHTGYVIVDGLGNTLESKFDAKKNQHVIEFEPGAQFLERSMKSGPSVCLSSATFRKAALVDGGGLRPEDGVIDDFPLLLRIADDWDYAYLNRPLAVMRAHDEAASSELGSFRPGGFRSTRALPDILYEHRGKALSEVDLPEAERQRLARLAKQRYRRDVLSYLSMRATTGDGSLEVFRAFGDEIRRDRRLLLDPMTWRFVVGQLGARRLRDGLRRALARARDGG
jgi:glycosyltransferase involved in cell wall biosynthesis